MGSKAAPAGVGGGMLNMMEVESERRKEMLSSERVLNFNEAGVEGEKNTTACNKSAHYNREDSKIKPSCTNILKPGLLDVFVGRWRAWRNILKIE